MATKLPMDGEQWFKNQSLIGANVSHFLKVEYHNEDLSRGVQRKWLKDYWNEVLKFMQLHITCEGRHTIFILYHFIFLLHIVGSRRLNLPFFY